MYIASDALFQIYGCWREKREKGSGGASGQAGTRPLWQCADTLFQIQGHFALDVHARIGQWLARHEGI